jgi:hypothetical protein
MAEAVAPVSFTASLTEAKTGFPKCVDPAFLGFVPPTTLVPELISIIAWNLCKLGGGTVCDCLLSVETIGARRRQN